MFAPSHGQDRGHIGIVGPSNFERPPYISAAAYATFHIQNGPSGSAGSWSTPVHMPSAPARLRTPPSWTASLVHWSSPVSVVDVCAPSAFTQDTPEGRGAYERPAHAPVGRHPHEPVRAPQRARGVRARRRALEEQRGPAARVPRGARVRRDADDAQRERDDAHRLAEQRAREARVRGARLVRCGPSAHA
jgi:hypothetical protein